MTASQIIDRLNANPMFQLSTAGQELFHSNMLYWLAKHRRSQSIAIWELLGVPNPTDAFRELRHIDLLLHAEDRRLVLENKVLALPDRRQLKRYVDTLLKRKDADYSVGTSWVLLSLAPPAFLIEPYRGVTWKYVSYGELLVALRDTLRRLSGDDGVLFGRYVKLVEDLVALTSAFNPGANSDDSFQMTDSDRLSLERARLLTLVRKQQMSRCAEMVRTRLSVDKGFKPQMLKLGAGISTTSKEGLIEHFIEDRSGAFTRWIGWQLEGDRLRMVGILDRQEANGISMEKRGHALEGSYPSFFKFDFASSGTLMPYSGKKEWLRYGGEFWYKYQSVPEGTTWRQLIDLLVAASERTRSEVSKRSWDAAPDAGVS